MAHQPNAILAISSTDRFTTNVPGNVNQPVSNVLAAQFLNQTPYSNDFQITAPGALLNGYIDKLIVSQIQLQYYIPTIVPGRNDKFNILVETSPGSSAFTLYSITLPYGFYTPKELATMLQVFLNTQVFGSPIIPYFTVRYTQGNVANIDNIGFTIQLDRDNRRIALDNPLKVQYNASESANLLRTYKLFGLNVGNINPSTTQFSNVAPTFLYTPYIDIYSDALTNYQSLKDSDSSTSKRKGLVSRVYLSGVGNPQVISELGNNLGSEPFILTFDLNNPKVIKWTPDTAINSLDFQLRDCYGDLIFTSIPSGIAGEGEVFNTEWQMTLLCVESK